MLKLINIMLKIPIILRPEMGGRGGEGKTKEPKECLKN